MAFDGFVISNLVYELNNTILNTKISKIKRVITLFLERLTHLKIKKIQAWSGILVLVWLILRHVLLLVQWQVVWLAV